MNKHKSYFIAGVISLLVFGCFNIAENTTNKSSAIIVDIQSLDPTIFVELKYSTEDNFMHRDVYGDLEICYLRKTPAEMLVRAHHRLKEKHPDLRFLVYDGLRPRSIQWKLWNMLDDVPESERTNFVANPKTGSIHNFGAAVDLTLADTLGVPLDMGTGFDYFGELAFPALEDSLLNIGALTSIQVRNRKILREAMQKAGFSTITTEWWHFNAFPYSTIRSKYEIVE